MKKQINNLIEDKYKQLKENKFFSSTERISDLAIIKYDEDGFEKFKKKIKPILINICELDSVKSTGDKIKTIRL